MTELELYLKTNPVFTTAESCLLITSMTGDQDAVRLRDALGLSLDTYKNKVPKEMGSDILNVIPGIIASMESRYETHNNFIDASGIRNIVDLPCGFEPRGLRYARKHMHYYGLDLPAVIGRVGDVAISITEPENREYLHYASVDATNYESLRKTLSDVEGEILITTEGMLSYFTDTELKTVLQNITALLEEFGGCWITFDRFSIQHVNCCLQGILGDVGKSSLANLAKVSGRLADFQTKNNILYAADDTAVLALMDEIGLTVEKIPFTNYSADLNAVKTFPEGTMDRINCLLEKIELWVVRAKKREQFDHNTGMNPTKIEVENANGKAELILSGRLDSLNTPKLLNEFLKLEKTQEISHVIINLEKLEYISSAGIRTILFIMEKKNGNCLITGYNDSIRGIIRKAGHDEAFILKETKE